MPARPAHLRPDRTFDDVRLDPWQRWPMLAVLVAVFLLAGRPPVWRDPFDIDRAIWLSYAPIPALVVACLWWKRRLSLGTAFLNIMEIVMLKFTLTYGIAMSLWALIGAPAPPDKHVTVSAPSVAAPLPDVTDWRGERRVIRGIVKDGAGAWVFVADGLDDIIEPWPAESRVIAIDAHGFAEPMIVARRWQPLVGQSRDGRLHTVTFEGRVSVPLLPSGELTPVPEVEHGSVLRVRCAIHGESTNMLLLHHPYAAQVDESGRFELTNVPAVPVTLSAWSPTAKELAIELE